MEEKLKVNESIKPDKAREELELNEFCIALAIILISVFIVIGCWNVVLAWWLLCVGFAIILCIYMLERVLLFAKRKIRKVN